MDFCNPLHLSGLAFTSRDHVENLSAPASPCPTPASTSPKSEEWPSTRIAEIVCFLSSQSCDTALLQETNTQSVPSLPEDQPFVYQGPEDTHGREAAPLVHDDFAAFCNTMPHGTMHSDISWRAVDHGRTCPSTAIASHNAPHVGCNEAECPFFWRCSAWLA